MKTHSKLYTIVAITALALLPNCGQKKQDQNETVATANGSEVLLSLNGEPVITVQQLDDYINQAKEVNPQVEMIMQIMPNARQDVFYKSLKGDKIVREDIKRKGIDKTAEYQKKKAMMLDAIEASLAAEFFREAHKPVVTDAEVKEFYNKNKENVSGIQVSAGGVDAQAVSFTDKAKAQEFMTKVKASGANFAAIAKEQKLTVLNFGGPVSERSRVDNAKLKEMILAAKKFPSIELVPGDKNTYFVVELKGKSAAKYLPFEQVQEGIKNMVLEKKAHESFEKKLTELEKQYGFASNEAYWQKAAQQAAQVGQQEQQQSPAVAQAA